MSDNTNKDRVLKCKVLLVQWIDLSKGLVKEFYRIADNLDAHYQRISKAKIAGSAAGIVGGIVSYVGFSLAFFTFGASLGLIIAGGIIAGTGGVTVGGSVATDAILSRKRKKSVEQLLSKYNEKVIEARIECIETDLQIQRTVNLNSSMEETFPFWSTFIKNLVKGSSQAAIGTGFSILYTTISSSLKINNAVNSGLEVGTTLYMTLGTVGRTFHILGGWGGMIAILFDWDTLINSAVAVRDKDPHDVSLEIRTLAAKIEQNCPTVDEIEKMIEATLDRL